MNRIKKYLAVSLMSLILVSNSIPCFAAITSCPNGCASNAVLYSKTVQWIETKPKTYVVNNRLVTCNETTTYYMETYVCSKCSASRGNLTYSVTEHSINHN